MRASVYAIMGAVLKNVNGSKSCQHLCLAYSGMLVFSSTIYLVVRVAVWYASCPLRGAVSYRDKTLHSADLLGLAFVSTHYRLGALSELSCHWWCVM